ncbi:MAG: ATP-binding protein, partial [Bacteroidota bacterium]
KKLASDQVGYVSIEFRPDSTFRSFALLLYSSGGEFWLEDLHSGEISSIDPSAPHPNVFPFLTLGRVKNAESGFVQWGNYSLLPWQVEANQHLRLWFQPRRIALTINDWRSVQVFDIPSFQQAENLNILKFIFYTGSLFMVLLITFFLTVRSLTMGGLYFLLMGLFSFLFMTGYYPFGSYISEWLSTYFVPSVYLLPLTYCFYILFMLHFFRVRHRGFDCLVGGIVLVFLFLMGNYWLAHNVALELSVLAVVNSVLIPLSIPIYVIVAILGRKEKKWPTGASYIALGVLFSNVGGVIAAVQHGSDSTSLLFGTFDSLLIGHFLEHLFFALGIIRSVEKNLKIRGEKINQYMSELTQKDLEKEQLKTKLLEEQQELMEQKILERTRQLSVANETKDKFFSIVAHDLRSPMIALQGIGEKLDYYIECNKKEKLLEFGGQIDQSIDHLNHLLNNLLHWASAESGVLPFQPKVLSSTHLLNEVRDLYLQSANNAGITIKTEGPDCALYADFNMVASVFRNLLSNAIKYSSKGSFIYITTFVRAEEARISIADQGPGMSESQLANLFTATTGAPGVRGEQGFGLGLMLAKEFTEKNSGLIEVASQKGNGTTFSVTFPLSGV